jgi:hypothetical protein
MPRIRGCGDGRSSRSRDPAGADAPAPPADAAPPRRRSSPGPERTAFGRATSAARGRSPGGTGQPTDRAVLRQPALDLTRLAAASDRTGPSGERRPQTSPTGEAPPRSRSAARAIHGGPPVDCPLGDEIGPSRADAPAPRRQPTRRAVSAGNGTAGRRVRCLPGTSPCPPGTAPSVAEVASAHGKPSSTCPPLACRRSGAAATTNPAGRLRRQRHSRPTRPLPARNVALPARDHYGPIQRCGHRVGTPQVQLETPSRRVPTLRRRGDNRPGGPSPPATAQPADASVACPELRSVRPGPPRSF